VKVFSAEVEEVKLREGYGRILIALRCFGESGFVTFDVVDLMSLIPSFSWRRGHCPVALMKCKKPFRLISERLFACRARFSFYASDERERARMKYGRERPESDGYFAASVAFAAAARFVAPPAGEPIAWNSNAVSLSRALS
jgi:hypothetical protein